MDKRLCVPIIALLALSFQAACGPTGLAPTALAPIVIASPVVDQPTAVPSTAEAAPTTAAAAPAPPVLSMEVGTTFHYFDGGRLVPVAAGPFVMGGGGPDNPVHTVNVSDFWIYSTEVTNRMYSLCVAAGKCSPPDAEDNPIFSDARQANRPVVGVTWQQSADYCAFVNGRLPTEAEWEKTARGTDARIFPWGNEQPTCDRLNFGTCVNKTTNVGLYPKGESPYHAVDMSGNAREWVLDIYQAAYYQAAPTQDPVGPEKGTKRAIRSSAFNSDAYLAEAARRSSLAPDQHRAELGFRCVVDDPTAFAPLCATPLLAGQVPPGGASFTQAEGADCNKPIVVQGQDCKYTNVTVYGDDGGAIEAVSGLDGCTPDPNNTPAKSLYTCFPGGTPPTFKVCGRCTYPEPTDLHCADGYVQNGNQCFVKDTWPGLCPDGTVYDPTKQCCAPAAGFASVYELNCPDGYYPKPDPSGATELCVLYPTDPICVIQTVAFKVCQQPNPNCDPTTDPNCAPGCVPNPATGVTCVNNPPSYCQNCPTCPGCPGYGQCLDSRVEIGSPNGQTRVTALKVGDPVWTVDASGNRVPAPIIRISSTPVLTSHAVVHLILADGRELYASPGHPTADGRTLGALAPGDAFDGSIVTAAHLVSYNQPATYDILPSGETGYYWANGILLASTLSGR